MNTSRTAFTAATVLIMQYGAAPIAAASTCTNNGQIVPCPAGMEGGVVAFMVISFVIAAAAFVFWLWMLIHCLSRDFNGYDKIIWVVVLMFTGTLGAVIYYFVVKRKLSDEGPTSNNPSAGSPMHD